ncbi:MAG: hypothetical protein CVV44_08740 [Spirochaetae bacterium HGW-Spirochaetae-1]|jgi:nucleoid-associated protein YgaU|nr:MAG: hypothetical protein CVV44_08740 [Spirochaetae bacterium HGW-Spirochaetae-1]
MRNNPMKKILLPLISILLPAFFAGCQLDVPIKAMVSARSAITRGYEVKADTYAPEELKSAEDKLYESHSQLKKGDIDKAKSLAVDSKTDADAAIEKSLPLLARDTLALAKQAYDQAEKLYAEKYAPEDFSRTAALITESENLMTQNMHWDSYLKSKEALSAANAAMTASESQIDALRSELDTIKTSLVEIKTKDLNKDAQDAVTDIESFISVAENDLNEKDLKRATAHISEASSKLDTLKNSMAAGDIKARIGELRDETDALKNERGSDFALKEIDGVTALLNEAETSLEQKNLDDSRQKISDAEAMLKTARENTDRGIATEKLEAVSRLRDDLAARDKNKKFTDEITGSGNLITQSRELLDQGANNDSLQKSIEAEALLNTVSVSLEKEYGIVRQPDQGTDTAVIAQPGETQIYVVQYYKKDKDCLWRIAQKVYKDARQWPRIYVANKDQIKDPDLIFPGQKFVIPPLAVPEKKMELKEDTGKEPAKDLTPENTIDDDKAKEGDTEKDMIKENEDTKEAQ